MGISHFRCFECGLRFCRHRQENSGKSKTGFYTNCGYGFEHAKYSFTPTYKHLKTSSNIKMKGRAKFTCVDKIDKW